MTAKTTAQWRQEFPAYDGAIRAVERLRKSWPGTMPRVIAHIHPDTHVVSIILDGSRSDTIVADEQLAGFPNGWTWDTTYERAVWRKTVSR